MPPSPVTRRRFLQTAGGSIGLIFAGCTSIQGDTPEGSNTATTAEPPRESTPLHPEVLNPTASVVRQPSDEKPALVELGLENTGSEDIAVRPGTGGGHALGYLDQFVPRAGQDGNIVLHPGPEEVVVRDTELPEEPVNGCWRWPEEATRWTIDLEKFSRIEGDGAYTIGHEVYSLGPEDKCFPAGDYQAKEYVVPVVFPTPDHPGSVGRPEINLSFTLTANASGEFSVTVERI